MSTQTINQRIFLVVDTTHGQIGGTEQNTLRFAQTLAQRGHTPLIIEVGLPILAKSSDAQGLTLVNIPTQNFSEVSWKTWRTLIKTHKPRCVLRSKTWVGCVNTRLDAAMLFSPIPYLSWEHHPATEVAKTYGGTSQHPLRNTILKIKRTARLLLHMNSVKRTVTVSHAVRDPLIKRYPINAAKVDCIYPGVDFNYFTHNQSARHQLRASWGIPTDALVIGSLGRLAPHKGNDFMLQVLAAIMQKSPSMKIWCVIAGKGSDLTRLETIAKSLGISARVKFAGWQENAANTWSAIDVFLMPSSDEGLGMTLIEAAASGCIPIAARVGGMQEILCGALDNYLCNPNDLNTWANLTSDLLLAHNRAEQHRIIYKDLEQRFSAVRQWSLMADWLEASL